jgi:hypothetical protein
MAELFNVLLTSNPMSGGGGWINDSGSGKTYPGTKHPIQDFQDERIAGLE